MRSCIKAVVSNRDAAALYRVTIAMLAIPRDIAILQPILYFNFKPLSAEIIHF